MKTYYVRVRAYKKVGGKKNYGNWSKVKKIRIKNRIVRSLQFVMK